MRSKPIQQRIEQLKNLNQSIRVTFDNNNLSALEEDINKYNEITEDANLISIKSNYFFQKGDYEQATKVLEEGIKQYPFNFDINLNLGIVYEMKSLFTGSFHRYVSALKYASTIEKQELAKTYINRMTLLLREIYQSDQTELLQIIEDGNRFLGETDYRSFPMDHNRQNTIRQPQAVGTSDEYMTNLYRSYNDADIDEISRHYHMTETLKGRIYKSEQQVSLAGQTLLPVSTLESETILNFNLNGKNYSFSSKDLPYYQYNYLRFNERGLLNITMNKPIFIGTPIPLQEVTKKKRLIFNIFVDGLSFEFLQKHDFQSIMPYTHAYFQKGFTSTNCYATSEWTFPSVASMYTGKYTTSHGLFHPNFNHAFAENNKMMQEHFKEAGYLTAHIGGDWRVTPAHGYHKGFDRILYQNFMGGMDCKQVITESIEHLETFKEKNNFMWISLADVHHVPDEMDCNLMTQAQIDISKRVRINEKGSTTVLTPYDINKHEKYILEIKRIDFYLNILYTYLNQHFQNEEILVLFYSDHGQSFLEDQPFLLHESRRKVPFMIRGGDVPVGESDEFMELIDILPTLLHYSDLSAPEDIDGHLPACLGGEESRKFAFTEAIHPNQTYKAAITDEIHIFKFENGTPIQNDGLVDLNEYKIQLINKETGSNETDVFPDKADHYEEVVWEHIRKHIIIS
ncbi:sulfatase-like hydrolase/transferase [Paenibacillus kribbensis]|uniref:sulfatase-like hydrolase/transferase n=1 Tax=Paenibacillus kribbensis TaxID=172713 RepID=UPI002DB97087|nr:sulfatase-like hydrolase/transferase [Paenibacillus kribbensis]MEC0233807.1 sulfatase-like hydrolase/transferase [Paenibacillus kribbensis]